MHQRQIVDVSQTASISLPQARRAAKAIKMAKSARKTNRDKSVVKTGCAVNASTIERYLGHFGTASAGIRPKSASSGKKNGVAKRTSAR